MRLVAALCSLWWKLGCGLWPSCALYGEPFVKHVLSKLWIDMFSFATPSTIVITCPKGVPSILAEEVRSLGFEVIGQSVASVETRGRSWTRNG